MAEIDFMAMLKAEKAKAKAESKKSTQKKVTPKDTLILPELIQISSGVAYCPDFISQDEESSLITDIDYISQNQWATLTQRRLLNLGGIPHPSGSWSEELPEYTELICSRLVEMGVFKTYPNQILLNEYCDGAGIDPHNDGPLYQPLACIVSLNSDAIIDFYEMTNKSNHGSGGGAEVITPQIEHPSFSVVLRRRSLVVFSEEKYISYVHGIQKRMEDKVDKNVINMKESNVRPGELLVRSSRRLSVTVRTLSNAQKHISTFDVLTSEERNEKERREAWWCGSISEK